MKKKRQLILGIGVLLILVMWGLYRSKHSTERKARERGTNVSILSHDRFERETARSTELGTNASSKERSIQEPEGLTKEEEVKSGLAVLNHVPIEFYGKVEDQDGNPLPDTQVAFSIQYRSGLTSGVTTNQVRTDAQGYFTISGYKGEALSVIPHKSGYIFASTNGGGIYSHMWPAEDRVRTPDPANPVIIRMWKLKGPEELVAIDKRFRVPFSGTPYMIDLAQGRVVEGGGDLIVTPSIQPGDLPNSQPFSWEVKIAAVAGGVREVSEGEYQITHEAPAEGYEAQLSMTMHTTNRLWQPSVGTRLFVKSRHGAVLSKIFFSFGFDPRENGPAEIWVKGYVNAHGSRNWEVDPAKLVHR